LFSPPPALATAYGGDPLPGDENLISDRQVRGRHPAVVSIPHQGAFSLSALCYKKLHRFSISLCFTLCEIIPNNVIAEIGLILILDRGFIAPGFLHACF